MNKYRYAIIEMEELIDEIVDGVGSVRLKEAAELAIQSIKRQEPMKPVIEQGAPSYYGGAGICRDYCGCPKCGEEVGRGDDKANYCPECGQRIDWTED